MLDTPRPRSSEAGFTLVEALVAMIVLAVGITAVANLMLVGASSNSVGNAATASTALASRELERLKAIEYMTLAATAPGGDLDNNAPGFFRIDDVPGIGRINTRWTVAPTNAASVLFITVQSEGEGAMTRGRSRARFTVFRSCTTGTADGCP